MHIIQAGSVKLRDLHPDAAGDPLRATLQPDGSTVRVHPREGSFGAAALGPIYGGHVEWLRACALTSNPDASEQEYMLAICTAGQDLRGLFEPERDAVLDNLRRSGWMKVAPMREEIVSLYVGAPPVDIDVLLLTRTPSGGHLTFAWCDWYRLIASIAVLPDVRVL